MILRSVAQALSPSGPRAQLSILIFHRVLSQPDALFPGEPDMRRFDEIISWVKQWFHVLPLDQAIRQLQRGELRARAAAITFDDGYADNADNALPVLLRHGVTATFFVATAFLDGGRMWNDSLIEVVRRYPRPLLDLHDIGLSIYPMQTMHQKRHCVEDLLGQVKYLPGLQRAEVITAIIDSARVRLPDNLMLRTEQLLALHQAGMQIGAHTVSHPILTRIPDNQALYEIIGSKIALESLLGEAVTLFAYPNGKPSMDYAQRHVSMVQAAGYAAAVSTAAGVAQYGGDPYQLPRFTPWDQSRLRYGLRMLTNLRPVAQSSSRIEHLRAHSPP